MNIHSQEYEDLNDELLYHFNEEFEKYSQDRKISFDNLVVVAAWKINLISKTGIVLDCSRHTIKG